MSLPGENQRGVYARRVRSVEIPHIVADNEGRFCRNSRIGNRTPNEAWRRLTAIAAIFWCVCAGVDRVDKPTGALDLFAHEGVY
jgi:hypothetical protein